MNTTSVIDTLNIGKFARRKLGRVLSLEQKDVRQYHVLELVYRVQNWYEVIVYMGINIKDKELIIKSLNLVPLIQEGSVYGKVPWLGMDIYVSAFKMHFIYNLIHVNDSI